MYLKMKWYTSGYMAVKTSVYKTKERIGNPLFIIGISVIGIGVIAGAIFLGKSDNGEIDVSAAIQSSNQANIEAGGDASKNVEVIPDVFKDMPNGGLVPQENQPAQEIVEAVPAETASSTEGNSTTTPTENASTTPEEVIEDSQE